MHTLLDLRGNIPSFIHISDGKAHDVHALDLLLPEAGAIYVMDRGYIDFARLYVLHQAGAFFVTRAKSNLDAHRVYSAPTDRAGAMLVEWCTVSGRRRQVTEHEAALCPVHGGPAHPDAPGNLLVAGAGIGCQQNLRALDIRRECVDHVMALGEEHLRRVLRS